jgi:hypothetical protein
MKNSGMEDLFVDALIEIYSVIEPGNASQNIGAVEQITGRKPISFEQFVRDYSGFFN